MMRLRLLAALLGIGGESHADRYRFTLLSAGVPDGQKRELRPRVQSLGSRIHSALVQALAAGRKAEAREGRAKVCPYAERGCARDDCTIDTEALRKLSNGDVYELLHHANAVLENIIAEIVERRKARAGG